MKNKILIAALLFAAITGNAQESAIEFQVQQQNYLLLEGYQPNALIECYRTRGGGKQIDKIKLDPDGTGRKIYETTQGPAFVLNRKTSENISGTNKVIQLEQKEFTVKNISMDIIAREVNLSWEAQIPAGNNIEFKILRKDKEGDFKVIKTFTGSNGTGFNKYYFSETYQSNTSYVLQVMKDGKKLRYTTGPLGNASTAEWVKVYPTLCSDNLFIDLQSISSNPEYTVNDLSGKLILKAALNEQYNKIDMSKLSPGNYLISVTNNNAHMNFKIIKN